MFLGACLDLGGFTPGEVQTLREIHLAYAQNQHGAWGAANAHRETEVRGLFLKCQALLRDHVSQAHV